MHQFSVFIKSNRLFISLQGSLSEFDCEMCCRSVVTDQMAATDMCRALQRRVRNDGQSSTPTKRSAGLGVI